MLKPYIQKVVNQVDLSMDEAREAMKIIMTGEATPAQIGGYLIGLRIKGETIQEITGSALAMRNASSQVEMGNISEKLIDTAGTGGDGANTYNISTTAAFIIAGAGYPVAKHGNRAASSKSGSADVLEALGINLDLTPQQVKVCIDEIGIGFMFAPKFHPAMKHAIGPRKELGQRTIFNMLGPLTNPASAAHQLIGVYDPNLTEPIAKVLGELGGKSAFVIHGEGGLDELNTTGMNRISHLRDGQVDNLEFDASSLNLQPAAISDLVGGDADHNAALMQDILSGKDQGPRADVALLNAAAGLATQDGDIVAWLDSAKESLQSGEALNKLNKLVEMSKSFLPN